MIASPAAFRRTLLRWYGKHGRDLPWRHTRDPYAILVAEIMLQQTQVATVIPYYERWLARFPDFATLARAREDEVLRAWEGLGYYARARNLHATAQAIARDPDRSLGGLPGIGRYTANAVATFAFDASLPIVEANIARLLARLFDLQLSIDSTAGRKQLWSIAASLLPRRRAARFNSALMDLGATICTARQPKCERCVVRQFCRAEDPARLPLKKARAQTVALTEHHAFAARRGAVLLEQSQQRWRGMWILPRLPNESKRRPIYSAEFPFTHHRITLAVHRRSGAINSAKWFPIKSLAALPIPSPHRRALTHLLDATTPN
ncbi:MAG: A/G-specific adenine glycosylase [Verrucomicrobiota bacterium]|nr:A/G-specific adenine glycosylase [Verrucomicrobiota bacterium]